MERLEPPLPDAAIHALREATDRQKADIKKELAAFSQKSSAASPRVRKILEEIETRLAASLKAAEDGLQILWEKNTKNTETRLRQEAIQAVGKLYESSVREVVEANQRAVEEIREKLRGATDRTDLNELEGVVRIQKEISQWLTQIKNLQQDLSQAFDALDSKVRKNVEDQYPQYSRFLQDLKIHEEGREKAIHALSDEGERLSVLVREIDSLPLEKPWPLVPVVFSTPPAKVQPAAPEGNGDVVAEIEAMLEGDDAAFGPEQLRETLELFHRVRTPRSEVRHGELAVPLESPASNPQLDQLFDQIIEKYIRGIKARVENKFEAIFKQMEDVSAPVNIEKETEFENIRSVALNELGEVSALPVHKTELGQLEKILQEHSRRLEIALRIRALNDSLRKEFLGPLSAVWTV